MTTPKPRKTPPTDRTLLAEWLDRHWVLTWAGTIWITPLLGLGWITGEQFTELLWLLWLLFGGAMGIDKAGSAAASAIANWRKPPA